MALKVLSCPSRPFYRRWRCQFCRRSAVASASRSPYTVRRRRPGADVALFCAAELPGGLVVPVESLRRAENARADGITPLLPAELRVVGIAILKAEGVEIERGSQRGQRRGAVQPLHLWLLSVSSSKLPVLRVTGWPIKASRRFYPWHSWRGRRRKNGARWGRRGCPSGAANPAQSPGGRPAGCRGRRRFKST